ncbi:MAG: DUF937 domain-containing protein [Myxococcota bacterium]
MDLQSTIAQIGGKAAVGALAQKFGLDEKTTAGAVDALLPAITDGLKKNTQKEGGAEALVDAISSGKHTKYLDQPETLAAEETVADGNGILGHVLGSKEVSRMVAGQAAKTLGIDEKLAKQMLPVVASLAMSGLAKQAEEKKEQGARKSDLLSEIGTMIGGGGDVGALLGKLF